MLIVRNSFSIEEDCHDIIAPFLSQRETISEILENQKRLLTEIRSVKSLEEYNLAVDQHLAPYLQNAEKNYIENDKFILQETMEFLEFATGDVKAAVYRANYHNRPLFIKKLSPIKTNLNLLTEIQTSRILERLNIGPKTDLLYFKDNYYFIMEDINGINIKEVLYPENRGRYTKKSLDAILGRVTLSIDEAVEVFTHSLLSQPQYLKRIKEIQKLLEQYQFYHVDDFQFMIDLREGPSSIKVIDGEGFKRSDHSLSSPYGPENEVNRIFRDLRKIQELIDD
jgi:hypothetical protein